MSSTPRPSQVAAPARSGKAFRHSAFPKDVLSDVRVQFHFGLRHATAVRSACRDFRPGREPPAAPAPETSGQTQHEIPLSGRIDCSECRKNSNISTKKRDDFLFFSLLWLFSYMVYIFPYIVHRPETIGIQAPYLAIRHSAIIVPSGSQAPF